MSSTPKVNVGRLQHRLRSDFGKIVAIQRDVQRADRHFHAVDAAHGLRDALRQRHAAPANSDQRQVLGAAAFFHDFVRQPLQRAVDFRSGHQLRFFDDFHCAKF